MATYIFAGAMMLVGLAVLAGLGIAVADYVDSIFPSTTR